MAEHLRWRLELKDEAGCCGSARLRPRIEHWIGGDLSL